MKKLIRIIYLLMIAYILLVLFVSFDKTYLNFRKFPIIPNVISGLLSILIIYLLLKINIKLDDKKYKRILLLLGTIVFILQIVILKNTYFYTDWDVKAIRDAVLNNNIKGNYYLTKYPNTLLYLSIIKLYYSIPLIGKYYFPLLVLNALLVNLSGIVASLVIRKYTNNTYSIIGYILMSLLIILSPWINIPYSDTFVILIPILIIYLYTKDNKKKLDYILIGFLSILGYYIKPTAFIVLIGIVIISIIDIIKKKYKINYKIISMILVGMIVSFALCKTAIKLNGFTPSKTTEPFTMIHYFKMGQNNNTYGLFDEKDVEESDTMGKRNDLNKAIERIKERKIIGQFKFIRIKTLLNYNDGTFAWGREGAVFYHKVLAKDTKLSKLLRNYFYKDYKYNYIFKIIMQFLWILVLILSLFAGFKDEKDNNTLIYLSIIGITLFLTIFECRARYLYCYSPIFITLAIIGLNNIKQHKKGKKK